MTAAHLLYTAAWCGWCSLHSVLITPVVTDWFQSRLGRGYRFYRLGYNLIALLTLIPTLALGLNLRLGETVLFSWAGWLAGLRYGLLALCIWLFVGGARRYDLSFFLGVRQARTGETSTLLGGQVVFECSGVSGFVRHPWYLGGIILVWTVSPDLSVTGIITAMILSGYFIIGTILEERKLLRQFGRKYRDYQAQVSMLLPLRWARNQLKG